MGTRGLTAVVLDGEYKIAQYGQWDHYPSGQGVEALEFCREWLTNPVKESQFTSNLAATRFATDEDQKACTEWLASIGSVNGWLNGEQSQKYKERYPLWSRDLGADVLSVIASPPPGVDLVLRNSIDFAGDSLFCEYAYVIDIDKRTFEVFKGFNNEPLEASERFATAPTDGEQSHRSKKYEPVKLLKSFDLDKLPSKRVFLEICEPDED